MNSDGLRDIANEVKRSLLHLQVNGCKGFDCSEKSLEIINSWGKDKVLEHKKSVPTQPTSSHSPDRSRAGINPQNRRNSIAVPEPIRRDETLEAIRTEIGDCQRCNLGAKRNNLVFGAGNPDARLAFVGEAPGHDEDMQGKPFVGASGQLLTKMINAMGLGKEDVYICNIIKCRPAGNRNPLPEEIITCLPFLQRQLEVIKPEIICTLGGFATQALLEKTDGITRLRGRFHHYYGIRVMPIFHPAYLLRNASKKREAWDDLQKIMAPLERTRQK